MDIFMDHGGDIETYQKYTSREIIDFSSNINPLGLPDGLKDFLTNNLGEIKRYPDPKYRRLKVKLEDYLEVPKEHIVLGNGAIELIEDFIILGKRLVNLNPSFSEYEKIAKVHNKEVLSLYYRDDFSLDLRGLYENLREGDVLVLTNPNNPTGLVLGRELLIEIYNLVLQRKAYLLLDEAFYEFAEMDYTSLAILDFKDYKNLMIIRAATKFFGLAGLRLGYGVTSLKIRDEIEKKQLSWHINSLADLAGSYIFSQEEYIKKSISYVRKERQYLLEEMKNIEGIRPVDSRANYILFKVDKDEADVFMNLLKKGILVRTCSSFKGLEPGYIRVAVRKREENKLLIEGLKSL